MNTSESFQALRRANPRARDGFARSAESAAEALHARVVTATVDAGGPGAPARRPTRRRLVRVSAVGVSLAAAAAMAAVLTFGSPGVGPGVANAAVAVRNAAAVTAAAAEESGTAVVRITHNGEAWAGSTIRWNGDDVAVSRDHPQRRGKVGDELLVVDGVMYGLGGPFDDGWVELGDPKGIDPDSGTTPDEYLAMVGEDVGGATLRRLIDGMTGPAESQLPDGGTVYSGSVPAGLVARETGFKEDQAIRVLPFGYVAHDEAADPDALLDAAVTVGANGVIREIAVTWGAAASAWTYTVAYSGLGETPAPAAPENARPLREVLRRDK